MIVTSPYALAQLQIYIFNITIFALKRSGVWLLASPILITFRLGTRNKGQEGLATSFSIIDYLYTGNQQLMQKMDKNGGGLVLKCDRHVNCFYNFHDNKGRATGFSMKVSNIGCE